MTDLLSFHYRRHLFLLTGQLLGSSNLLVVGHCSLVEVLVVVVQLVGELTTFMISFLKLVLDILQLCMSP